MKVDFCPNLEFEITENLIGLIKCGHSEDIFHHSDAERLNLQNFPKEIIPLQVAAKRALKI